VSYKLSFVIAADAVECAPLFNLGLGRGPVLVLDIAHLDGDIVRNLAFAGLNRNRRALFSRRDRDNCSAYAILVYGLRTALLRAQACREGKLEENKGSYHWQPFQPRLAALRDFSSILWALYFGPPLREVQTSRRQQLYIIRAFQPRSQLLGGSHLDISRAFRRSTAGTPGKSASRKLPHYLLERRFWAVTSPGSE
jgi:hypothetical protein